VTRPRRGTFALLVSVVSLVIAGAAYAGEAPPPSIRYTMSLARAAAHLLEVRIELPAGESHRDLQLPVWNALYQVRDFSQYVNWVKATAGSEALHVEELDKTTWRVNGTSAGATVEYEISAQSPGPYGAELNGQHAFFNLAEVLMYPTDGRHAPVEIRLQDVPMGWRIATALPSSSPTSFAAEDYDHLVDGPVEIGRFRDAVFDVGGAHYQVVVDADPADYDMQKIVAMVKSIVVEEVAWMNDRPFDHYVFIYHFPRAPGGGGMEHAYSTAIQLNARFLGPNPQYLYNVSAHEFFHLWNVKRIRPQSLEPIDYTKENYTPSLWFSEGFTSTVAPLMLFRAKLIDEPHFLQDLADEITNLQTRPAHLTQSAEQSSLDAWLEKYSYYRIPERSISYYNKGEVLGVMLDLEIREATHGAASLREMFRWMNEHYAKQKRFFPDTEGIRQAAEAVSHENLDWFFQKYVAGLEEIPYDRFFKSVGFQLVRVTRVAGDPEFSLVRSFEGAAFVGSVKPRTDPPRAGLKAGDEIVNLNGQEPSEEVENQLSLLRPGDTIKVDIKSENGRRSLAWRVGTRDQVEFALKDVNNITPQQRARRAAWLAGEDYTSGDARP
jgi:predicted metalloprotease with PDZ domain